MAGKTSGDVTSGDLTFLDYLEFLTSHHFIWLGAAVLQLLANENIGAGNMSHGNGFGTSAGLLWIVASVRMYAGMGGNIGVMDLLLCLGGILFLMSYNIPTNLIDLLNPTIILGAACFLAAALNTAGTFPMNEDAPGGFWGGLLTRVGACFFAVGAALAIMGAHSPMPNEEMETGEARNAGFRISAICLCVGALVWSICRVWDFTIGFPKVGELNKNTPKSVRASLLVPSNVAE